MDNKKRADILYDDICNLIGKIDDEVDNRYGILRDITTNDIADMRYTRDKLILALANLIDEGN